MPASPPTPEELLRLARKAKPGFEWEILGQPDGIDACVMDGDHVLVDVVCHTRARQALHAALLVLSGELDAAELLAERDRLRDGIKLLIAGAEEERYGGGPVVGVGQLEQLLEDP